MSTSILQLQDALTAIKSTTTQALTTSSSIARRSAKLSTLTSPASDTSNALTQTSTRVTATLSLLRDAREKLDTVVDCEPSIDRLYCGVRELDEVRQERERTMVDSMDKNDDNDDDDEHKNDKEKMTMSNDIYHNTRYNRDDDHTVNTMQNTVVGLTEQDVYAAADSLEIIRDAYGYFEKRPDWKATKNTIAGLERVHQLGVDAMCRMIQCHLLNCGPGVKVKRGFGSMRRNDSSMTKAYNGPGNRHAQETARETRTRLTEALKQRDLMKEVGEYEESLPLETRTVRELRAIFECLGGDGCYLSISSSLQNEIMEKIQKYQIAASKASRTERIGSGYYSKISMRALDCGYPHLNAYVEARRTIAFRSIHAFYKSLRDTRKKVLDQKVSRADSDFQVGELDSAARDTVRCLEHAMVIVAGEKSIYRCVVSPTSSHTHDSSKVPEQYKHALAISYSHVCSAVVDRVVDIIELFFMKDANLRNVFPSGDKISTNTTDSVTESGADGSSQNIPSVYFTASAAASGLRILDAVRMLGPSLAKLCEMSSSGKSRQGGIETQGSMSSNMSKESSTSLASNLCIAIHRMTVKNVGKCLENVALSIKHDPLSGDNRPSDGRVAPVSSDVVRAIRLIYPFVNAYKSVTKRRVLPWDPKIGDSAGEIDYFIRYLVMTLISNLNTKAQQYTKDPGIESEAKSCLFMMNNSHYLSENLASVKGMSHSYPHGNDEDEGDYRIKDEWFTNQLDTLFSSSKSRYLNLWDKLNQHVSMIPEQDFSYVNADKQLTLESGRILKACFNGFNENFEKMYSSHMKLTVIDLKLRQSLIQEIKDVFLPNYRLFFDKYSSYNFSKKNKDDYLRYPPSKIEQMMDDMFLTF